MGSASDANSEQYCLRWNDFESNITSALTELRQEDSLLDVTLVAASDLHCREIRAHRLVLCACSPLFRKWLTRQNAQSNPVVILSGVKFEDIQALLNFMYHGEVNVNQEDLQGFLGAAEELRIRGLSDKGQQQQQQQQQQHNNDKKSNMGGNCKRGRNSVDENSAKRPKPSVVITPDIEDYEEDEHEEDGSGNEFGAAEYANEAGASNQSYDMNLYNSPNGVSGKQSYITLQIRMS